jgi:eukaryotic-like serine/threonine-protein kinase
VSDSTIDDTRAIADRVPESTRLDARYEQGALLGEGGMGEVRECRDRILDRDVGLKLVRRDRRSTDLDARFVREALVQAQLEHPGVVPVYELGRTEAGRAFFTMRKIAGLTLDEILAKKKKGDASVDGFTRHRLLTAFAQVCLTVDYAHSRGVLHRDLKPGNVMFGDFGEVYVLDWGLAKITSRVNDELEVTGPTRPGSVRTKAADAETVAGATLGTPAYMAPEQIDGARLDARADVFALGCILFEILTLESLFDEAAIAARFGKKKIAWDARPSVRASDGHVPPEFDRVCVRATAAQKEKRYASARSLHDEVEAWLGGERDLELRRDKAKALLDRAESTRISDPDGALHDVNRALGLSPGDPRGLVLLVQLLEETPGALERGRSEAVSEGIERLRRQQPLGALLFTAGWVTIYPALMAVRGIRSVPLAILPLAAWLLTAAAMLVDHRQKTQEKVIYPTVLAAIALACTSAVFGPFLMVPAYTLAVIANTVLVAARSVRVFSIVLGCFAVVVPAILAWTGVHDVYHFTESTSFLVSPSIRSMHPENIGPMLVLVHVLMAVGSCLFASRFRDEIERARQASVLAVWHLARLLPAEIGTTAALPALPGAEPEPDEDSVARILDTAIDVGSRSNPTIVETTRILDSEPATPDAPSDPLAVIGPRYVPSPVTADLVRDELVQRDVVMKRPSSADEAILLARLDHPGVPPIYDLGEDDRGLWMTLKPVSGTRLADAARSDREHGRHRLLAAFAQVCLTMEFAHARGIVHGGLDATRIVLGDFGEVYVVDWSPSTRARIGPGAPEQAGGAAPTPRSDVFALGAVLFEVLACEPLVSGDAEEIVFGRYDARPSARGAKDVVAELDEIVVKATAYEPAERYPSARELHDAIEAFLGADRDAALRRKLAAEHLTRARGFEKGNDREGALREIGRALALAPERDEAASMLTRLVASVPNPLPPDVVREIETQRRDASARPAQLLALGYAAIWLVAFPIFALVVGVRDWLAVGLVVTTWALTVAGLAVHRRAPLLSLVGFGAVAVTSLLFGAYFVVPAAGVAMAIGHVLGAPPKVRPWIPLLAFVSIAAPALLGDARVLDLGGFFGTPERTIVIIRGSLVLWHGTLYLALVFVSVATLLVGCVHAATYRDVLEEMDATNRARVHALARLVQPSPAK